MRDFDFRMQCLEISHITGICLELIKDGQDDEIVSSSCSHIFLSDVVYTLRAYFIKD